MNAQNKTPMQLVGSEAPPGWNALVTPLIERCKQEGASIFQIKQKFGRLRFYADGVSRELRDQIDEAERASATVCEDCGAPGTLRSNGSWLRTLCDTDAKKRNYLVRGVGL